MNKMWVVTANTYLRQVKSWSFVALVLSPFIFIIISLGVGWISANSAANDDQIAVVTNETNLKKEYIAQTGKKNVDTKINTVKQAKQAVKNDRIKGYLVLKNEGRLSAVYHGNEELAAAQKAKTTSFLNQMQTQINVSKAQLTKTQLANLQQQPSFKQHVSKHNSQAKSAKTISLIVMIFMVYMIITTYSSITAQEIASEKGTKIMEIIFSSTTAAKYFCGKILGVLLVIFTQLVVYLAGGWLIFKVANQLPKLHQIISEYGTLVGQVIHNLIGINMVFLLFGVVIYTVLAAFCGALVSKAEDASKASFPAVYLSMFAFFACLPFQNNVDTLIVKVMSYVPFFSSYFMPMRVINQDASALEIGISLVILISVILSTIWYISRIYQGLILQADEGSFWKRFRRGLKYH